MPGDTFEAKFANLRAAYGFMMGHPGKKLLFMGQEFGQIDEWNENKSLEWELLQYPIHRNMQTYIKPSITSTESIRPFTKRITRRTASGGLTAWIQQIIL